MLAHLFVSVLFGDVVSPLTGISPAASPPASEALPEVQGSLRAVFALGLTLLWQRSARRLAGYTRLPACPSRYGSGLCLSDGFGFEFDCR